MHQDLHKGTFLCSWRGVLTAAAPARGLPAHALPARVLHALSPPPGASARYRREHTNRQDCVAGDPFDAVAVAKADNARKARTNELFCDAIAGLGAIGDDDYLLVLDGSQAVTCKHLAARGVPLSKILVPNVYTSSVASLRLQGVCNAFCCDVQDVLQQVTKLPLPSCLGSGMFEACFCIQDASAHLTQCVLS